MCIFAVLGHLSIWMATQKDLFVDSSSGASLFLKVVSVLKPLFIITPIMSAIRRWLLLFRYIFFLRLTITSLSKCSHGSSLSSFMVVFQNVSKEKTSVWRLSLNGVYKIELSLSTSFNSAFTKSLMEMNSLSETHSALILWSTETLPFSSSST